MRFNIDAFDALVATPYAIYRAAKDQDGDPREGSSLLMAGRVVMHYGVRVRQAFYEPLGAYDTILRGLERAEYLVRGGAPSWMTDHFSIAFQCFESAYSATNGVLTLPAPGERSLGHHAVAVVGWDDGGESLVFRNSWGRQWGDRGYGRVSREYLDHYWHEAWLSRNARYGPSWWSMRWLLEAASPVQYFHAWRRENPREVRHWSVRGIPVKIHIYETLSLEEGCRVAVVDIRDVGGGRRLGWAFLFHLRGEDRRITFAKELFVFRPYRRRGVGTALVNLAEELARRANSDTLRVMLHGHDAIPQSRGAARGFAAAQGYRWTWRTGRRPRTAGFAEKSL